MEEKKTLPKESSEDVAKAFNKQNDSKLIDSLGPVEKATIAKAEDKQKQEAENVLSYIVRLLSTGTLEVRVKNPCRRGKDLMRNPYAVGRLTSIISSFHQQKIKVTVSYSEGKFIKINGKRTLVPLSDTMYINNIEPIRIVKDKSKIDSKTK